MLLGGVPSSISQAPVASGAVTPSRNERSKAQTLCIRRNIYVSFATRFIITLVVVEVGCRASHLLVKNKNKKKVLRCFNFPNNKALLPTSFDRLGILLIFATKELIDNQIYNYNLMLSTVKLLTVEH